MTLQAIQVSFLDSVPNDLVIPWGFGCVPAVAHDNHRRCVPHQACLQSSFDFPMSSLSFIP